MFRKRGVVTVTVNRKVPHISGNIKSIGCELISGVVPDNDPDLPNIREELDGGTLAVDPRTDELGNFIVVIHGSILVRTTSK